MVLLAGALGFEIFLVLGQRTTALKAEADFRSKVEEFQRLATQGVLPHPRNVELTQDEIARQQEELALYIASIQDQEKLKELFGDPPTSPTNALFEIQFFVEEYRDRAVAGTGMEAEDLANEFFGFGAYSQAGPPESLLPTVHKQRVIVGHILDRLFEARPEALISVQRPGEAGGERAAPEPRGGARGQGQPASGAGGFSLNPQLSAAIPDVVSTSAYQVVFTGRSSNLRTFLNELADFEMPLIVRSVQVAPAGEDPARGGGQQEATGRRQRRPAPQVPESSEEGTTTEPARVDENIPLVADNLSRFTVAMEFIDLIPFENARN